MDGTIVLLLVFINAIIIKTAYLRNERLYWALVVSVPLLAFAASRLRRSINLKKIN